jgi:hypothetical protein
MPYCACWQGSTRTRYAAGRSSFYSGYFFLRSGACVKTEAARVFICFVVSVLGAFNARDASLATAGLVFSFFAM